MAFEKISNFLNKRSWVIPTLFVLMCVYAIGTIVAIELITMDDMSPLFTFSIGGELCAMMIAIMITISILPAHKRHSGYIRIFVTLLTIGSFVLFADTLQMLFDGNPKLIAWNNAASICVYSGSAIFIFFFFLYASMALKSEGRVINILTTIAAILLAIFVILPFVNFFYPLYFTIDPVTGIYARNRDTWWISQIYIVFAVIVIITAIILSKESLKTKLTILGFVLMPVIAVGSGGYRYGVSIQYTTMMVSLVLIYAFIFSENEKTLYSTNKELGMATAIQKHMLPSIFPPFPGRKDFDVFAVMNPAKEVGGDFYDFFLIDDDHIALVIADVSDKGVPAALFMMASKIMLKNSAMLGRSPKEVLASVNRQICSNNQEEMFVTVWFAILDLKTGVLTATNAGHENPIIKSPSGQFEILKDKHNFIVGWDINAVYTEYQLQLEPGSKIFVYTDGAPEATNGTERFGMDRMLESLHNNEDKDVDDIIGCLIGDIDTFVGENDQFDDVTMLCFEYKGRKEDKKEYSYTFSAKEDSLETALNPVLEVLEELQVEHKTIYKIRLALDELLTNIVSYAYDGKEGVIEVHYEVNKNPKSISITISDFGKEFNPFDIDDPDLTADVNDRKIGGLGVFLVKNVMDEFQYQRENDKNIVTIKKNI